jgi:ribosomal protein S19E (S16A)
VVTSTNLKKLKQHYAIGLETKSRMLTSGEIRRLAPQFLEKLGSIVGTQGGRAIDIISRKGRELTAQQVRSLLRWLNNKDGRIGADSS